MTSLLTTEYVHLLRAALCPTDEALAHWQAWCKSRHLYENGADAGAAGRVFSRLDGDVYRLMPMVYRNLQATNDDLLAHLQPIYETTRQQNQRLVTIMHTVLDTLQQANIETVLLAGGALSVAHYTDPGVRLMDDLDVLVPTHRTDDALAALRPLDLTPKPYVFRHRKLLPAMRLMSSEQVVVNLHGNVLTEHTYLGADDRFWADAHPLTWPTGLLTRTLSPTHLLFHTLVRGYGVGPAATLCWVPDSLQLIQNGLIGWNDLLDLAERFMLRIPVRERLGTLQTQFDLVLPAPVRQRLRRMVPTTAEQRYFAPHSTAPVNALSKGIQYLRRNQLAFRLFRQNDTRQSLGGYLWDHLNLRLSWPERELPF